MRGGLYHPQGIGKTVVRKRRISGLEGLQGMISSAPEVAA